MKTLNEHNRDRIKKINTPKTYPAGILCPKCEKEMHFKDIQKILLTNPPKQEVICPSCKEIGYKII